ncbi:MAG: DNA polymerase III subunit gamma/tau [Bryobacterales bacterium]|nr:DNA polymerase III subunit gamma/tau [Bryobacterales bacterium]
MYQVIARKYRPRSFAELIGQEHVKTTIENAISQRRIAHGYIFSGQRGTGKTTVARILARCLNCEQGPTITPCGVCASCSEISGGGSIDVIEIDAASNRGINEMRELRESVRFRPARDRYKIFIIDEAHQITNEAFNALLKTLEEPPEWVVFVMCTTESHKIPNTIASRCQQFSFRSVDYDIVYERARWICEQEGIEAEPEALAVITLAGEGSVRDSLSALDQAIACCGQKLEAAEVRMLLGRFSMQTLERVADALVDLDARRMLELIQEMERGGQNLQHFARELCRFFRNLLVTRVAGADSRLIAASANERQRLDTLAAKFSEEDLTRYLHLVLNLFQDLQTSLQPRMHLELGLVRLVHAGRLQSIEEILRGGALPSAGTPPPPPAPRSTPPVPQPPPSRPSGAGASAAFAPAPVAAGPVSAKVAPPPLPQPPAAPAPPAPKPGSGGSSEWRERLLDTLNEKGMTFIADAIEHSDVIDRGNELELVTTKIFAMAARSGDLQKVVDALAGRAMKVKVTISETAPVAAPSKPRGPEPDEMTKMVLDNPEVQRYRELFPGSEVRGVRNLKESS